MPKPSRRNFLKMIAAGAAVGIVPADLYLRSVLAQDVVPMIPTDTPTYTETMPNGVAVGDVTQTSAVLWTHSLTPGTVSFTYSIRTAWWDRRARYRLSAEVTDATLPVKVKIANLVPNTEYVYRVSDAAESVVWGRFRTPAAAGVKTGLHFGVSGDWRGELRPYVSLANVAEKTLDFFMEHGDTIYADQPSLDFPGGQAQTLADYRVKHNEVYSQRYNRNVWADIRGSTAVHVVLDDHEVANDFAGGAAPSSDPRFDHTGDYINQTLLYRHGMQALGEYNPLDDQVYEGTGDARVDGVPKFYRAATYGSTAAVFVLDARSFRDEEEAQLPPLQVVNPFAVVRSLAAMFTPGRTMLGAPQLADFKRDLLAAHEAGVTWKFVMLPEPIQHMGWFGGVDRWEGYAPERAEVLKFIEDNAIRNVVFVSADVHTTFINNLTYQLEASGEHFPTHCFEISSQCAAYYKPTGQVVVESAAEIGLFPQDKYAAYQQMSISEKDAVLEEVFNRFVLDYQGFSPLGLDDSLVNWQRTAGGWVVGHTYGWSEFEIAPDTETLTITTWGVPAYSPRQVRDEPDTILSLTPQIMSQLIVTPQMD